jgi:hypothetical protein
MSKRIFVCSEGFVLKGQFNSAQRQRLGIHRHGFRSGLKAQVNLPFQGVIDDFCFKPRASLRFATGLNLFGLSARQ